MSKYQCPVCGFEELREPPEGSFEICPSCGTEFGYNDSGSSPVELRELWIHDGARWFSPARHQPPGWDPYVQLLRAELITSTTTIAAKNAPQEPFVYRAYAPQVLSSVMDALGHIVSPSVTWRVV